MIRRGSILILSAAVLGIGLSSCASAPAAKPAQTPPAQAEPPIERAVPPVQEAAFDPSKVTPEEKAAAITDIRALILSLNTIIQRKDYEAWLGCLTDEYRAYYSRPDVLAQMSEYPILKRMGIRLSSIEDYFLYVVYPSRQNDRVDDIDFVGEKRVKAITLSPKGERQILYNLEKHGDTWKIGIGR
jgi:hypothetical protein